MGIVFRRTATAAGIAAMAIAMPAVAKTTRHHSGATRKPAKIDEIAALREQVRALTARLDAQASTQQQILSQAQAAQTQAQAATTESQQVKAAVAEQAAAVPEQVKVALASQPKPKTQWFDNTSVSGRMYFNFSNVDQKVNGARPAGEPNGITNGTGFNIKRFYLSIDHTFDSVFSADLTTDVSNAVGRTSNGDFNAFTAPSDAQLIGRGLYIKKAYLQAKINPAFIIRAGAADLPWVPYVEGLYGYRHIENTLIDRTGFGTSSDWGIHVLGDLANGLVSYQFSVVDGAGYRNVKVTKSVDFEGRVSIAYKGAFGAVGGYVGKLGNDTQSAVTFHTANRIDALAGYKNKMFTIGGEYFYTKNYNNNGVNYITSNTSDKGSGYSAFGSVQFTPKLSAFGRYDWVQPRKGAVNGLKDHYFNVGVQYSPAKIVDLALVYKRDKADNGIIATTNGNIGGAIDGTYDEIGLFGQLRF